MNHEAVRSCYAWVVNARRCIYGSADHLVLGPPADEAAGPIGAIRAWRLQRAGERLRILRR